MKIFYKVAHRSDDHIKSFETRYDVFNEEIIREIFKNELGLEVRTLTRPDSWGTAHVIYIADFQNDLRKLVFRANTGEFEHEKVMLIEKMITDRVLDIGVNTNKILSVDISREKI
ncbi:MAG: hypothetical protein Q9M91_05600 [Candidatus Dojkabacteria bacterium]|nr:hypothetical protein [Candidatus Dojkabacteria bacterium]